MKGKFFVIDGSDGSGKGTQTNLLVQRLKEEYNVILCDFPKYDGFFGKMVGKYLNNAYGDAINLNPYLISLIYAGDRWENKEIIIKSLNEGKIVISNRFTSSNIAHQGSKLQKEEIEDFINWIERLEFEIYKIPKPDKTFILFVPIDIAQNLVDQKSKREYTNNKRDAHESNSNYLKKTSDLFYEIAQKREDWIYINCAPEGKMLSKEEINNLLFDEIKKCL